MSVRQAENLHVIVKYSDVFALRIFYESTMISTPNSVHLGLNGYDLAHYM